MLFSRSKVFCLKIWELWRVPTTLEFNICIRFLLTNVYKEVFGIFLILLDLELFSKFKRPVFYTHIFYIFYINTRSKQKKNPKHSFKVGLSPSKKNSFYLLQWKPFKNYEKCFLILKALFTPEIFKFLSWLFGDVEKTARLES